MFEGVVADLLNRYVGKYVSNLDSSNLNLSIFKGDVELTDLHLRPEALTELNLPVEVKSGHIGQLKIDIPWTQLFTADIHVAIENVYIIASPITDRQYDPEKEKLLQNAVKREILNSIENPPLQGVVDEASTNPSLVEKLSSSLINRLQISVRHIHVRYEDTVTNGDHAFACGLMLKQLVVCTTDSHWEPRGSDQMPNMMHKLLKMEELSVYWNPYVPEQHLLKSRLNTDGWRNLLRTSIDSHSIFEEELDFIVEPVAAQARLIINTDNSFTLPKFFMDFTVEEIDILLSRQQFLSVISLKDSFLLMQVNQRYRKYHPNVSLKVSPKAWWKYAYTAVLEEVIRPFSWNRIKEHRALYRLYKNVYKKYLTDPDNKALQAKVHELEDNLNVTNILIAREQAKLEYAREEPDRARRAKKKPSGWFSWMWGEEEEEVVEVDTPHKNWLENLTQEEKEKLYAGIGYDENAKISAYPKKYVAQKVQVILKSCCLSLVNYSKKILQVSVTHLLSTLETRPGGNAFRVSCNTESFAIDGASIEHELIPILTSDIGVYAPAVNQVFTLDFESKPLYTEADYSLSMNVQPVEIVYDEHAISEVTGFFQLPQGGVDFKSVALSTLNSVADYSRGGLQYAIENHTTMHIALNMRSPYIVIPEFGTLHRGGNVLIIDLGTLRIESELQPKDVSLEDATMSEIESRLYDQFNMKISDVKVLLADSGDDWHTAQVQPNSEYHILPSVQVLVTFFNAVKPDFTQLPRHKLEAKVPSLEINISDKRLLLLATFLKNFPIPSSSSMATIGEDAVDGMNTAVVPPVHLDMVDAQVDPDLSMLRNIRRAVLGRRLIDRRDSARRSQGKVPTLMYTGDEPYYSASDYSDEDLDKLSDMLVIKPVDDNASVANNINMLMRMSLGELLINLSKEMDKEEKAYLMFRVDRLKIDSALTVHGYCAYATLGGIQLVDKIHVGQSGEYMEVLSTAASASNNLASVMYRKVDPDCPDFATYYGGVEHAIKIKVQSVSTLFDQSSMIYLNVFLQGIITSIQNLEMKTSSSTVMTTSDISMKDRNTFTERLVNMTSDQVDSIPFNTTKINLSAELENFTIKLTDSDSSLAEIKVKDFEGSVIARPAKMIIRSRLRDLSITDCTAGAIFPNILMLQDDNSLFDLKLVKYSKAAPTGNDNKSAVLGLNYSLRLRLGHIQAVVLGKFYWEMMRFFEPFVTPDMTEAAINSASTAVEKQGSELHQANLPHPPRITPEVRGLEHQNLRINLDIDVHTPTLLLPHDSKSTDLLMVQLGDLKIGNSFVKTEAIGTLHQEWNHIRVNLHSVMVQRVRLNLAEDTTEILHTLLEPLNFKTDVKLAIKPVVSDVKLDISGHLEKVKVEILQKDLQLMLGVLRYNLTEGSPPPSPGIVESPTIQNLQNQNIQVQTLPEPTVNVFIDSPSTSPPPSAISPDSAASLDEKSMTTVLFKLEGLTLTLFTDSGKELATRTSLCCLDMEKLDVSGMSHSDGDFKVNVSLSSISVTDTRPNSDLAMKRVISCSQKIEQNDELPLVSFIYKMSGDGNQKADLIVEKLKFHVHIPYMLHLLDFFNGAMETVNQSSSKQSSPVMPPTMTHAPPPGPPIMSEQDYQDQAQENNASPQSTSVMTVSGTLRQPEILFYADPTKADSRAAIVYSDISFEYRNDTRKQNIWLQVTDLKIVTKMNIQKLSLPGNLVMLPCCLELTQEVDLTTGSNNMKAEFSKLQFFVSASVMQLVFDLANMLQGVEKETPSTSNANTKDIDGKNLWGVSTVTSDKWLKNRPESEDIAQSIRPTESPKESLTLNVADINLFFEIEMLDQHVPILCLHTSIESKVEEWSRKMHIEAEVHLEVMYFNEKINVWEPLVEPVMEKEGVYRPWELLIKVIKAKTFPMICMYDEDDLTVPEELQTEVQQMMHRSRIKSSSSETDEADADPDMTVIKHKQLRRLRHTSELSYDTASVHSSVQGESDSEPDGFISTMTNKLGSIFSSDSSDADVSETEETDDQVDFALDKPVFLTSRGPVHMSAAKPKRMKKGKRKKRVKKKSESESNQSKLEKVIAFQTRACQGEASQNSGATLGFDEVDAGDNAVTEEDDPDQNKCMFIILDSQDRLLLNVTPQAIIVLQDVIQALTNPAQSELQSVRTKPRFKVENKLGTHTYVTVHPKVKVRKEEVQNATIYHVGEDDNIIHTADYEDEIDVIDAVDNKCDEGHAGDDHAVSNLLAKAGHTLVSAGAFVFEDEDDYLSGAALDQHRLRIQVEGFEQTHSILHKRACRRLVPLTPIKSEDMELENGVKYCAVMNVDMWHGRKTLELSSPLKFKNCLTLAVDLYCTTEDLKKFRATRHLVENDVYSKLATVEPDATYDLPLFVAYHCPVYVKPSDIGYELSYNPVWWQEMLQGKDKMKMFMCLSSQEDKKSFNFKAVCREGEPLLPSQQVPRTVPYYTICLYPPVVLHNYLPYDIHFALQGSSKTSSLTHGESSPLYTVDTHNAHKINIMLPDYLGSDWSGTLDISPDMEEFRAIVMETEVDTENINRHLSLSIHSDQSHSLDLRIYSPYWLVNKTDLPLQLRGSMSEAVYEFGSSQNPLLFRFKRHKKKKAKLRVYESRWSQSFSTDTIGSGGVVVCHDKERGKKYMFLVQISLSKLRLTKIVTIMPFFLVMNNSKKKLRYMEENENADLWIDIEPEQFQSFWPVTESFNMYVKYDGSNVSSLHFPIKSCHNTVLRMDRGRAICVEVMGGTDSPITIVFSDYEYGDAPVRVENLCEDVFIKIHQKNQSQVTLLSPNQSVLYTWDEPSAERTLMWNVYGRKRPSYPAFISKDGSGEVRLRVPSLRSASTQSFDFTDAAETEDSSSPDDESDEVDGLISNVDKALVGKTRMDKMLVYWASYLEGLQRVLLFTQDERVAKAVRKVNEGEEAEMAIFASLEGVSISVINAIYQEVALLTVASRPSVWEVEVKEKWRSLNVELSSWLEDQWKGDVAGANLNDQIEADLAKMLMMKPFMGPLKRTFHPGIWCQYTTSKHHTAVHMSLQTLQVDNQLPDAYFPTVWCPTPLPPYVMRRMGPKPFIEMGVMRRTVPNENVDTIRYAKVLIQEFNLKLDKGFILSLTDVVGQLQPQEKEHICSYMCYHKSFQLQCDLYLARQSLKEAATVMIASRPQKMLFEYIHLSPLKFHLSFSLQGTSHLSSPNEDAQASSLSGDIIDFFLNSVGVTLTEIKNVELRMAYFERKGALMSASQLLTQVQTHYTHQALQQAYVLILGLDVLGNPYGLVKDFTQGLGDFFYEPFLGSIQGRDDFTESLERGIHSLLGNTVGGTAGSVALISGSIGRTLAIMSFDDDYKRKRRLRMQQVPHGLPASLAAATKTLALGIGLGLSGVILDPIKGAHEDGVEGFFKGVGKGLLGLVTKPTGGVVDMISLAFDGIRRAAEMEGGVVARVRLPRYINPLLGLQPYSPHRAAGFRLMLSVMKGELAKTDIYWAHAPLSREEKTNIVLITDKHLLVLEKCRLWGGWHVDWKVSIDSILGIPAIVDGKMVFKIKEDDSSLNLFSSGDREITSKEQDILEWTQRQIVRVIRYEE